MPGPPRIQLAGANYHVVTRGDGRRQLFHDTGHYERFTRGLEDEVQRSGWIVLASCWMPNHWSRSRRNCANGSLEVRVFCAVWWDLPKERIGIDTNPRVDGCIVSACTKSSVERLPTTAWMPRNTLCFAVRQLVATWQHGSAVAGLAQRWRSLGPHSA